MDLKLLKDLCQLRSATGEEYRIREYLLDYVTKNKNYWKKKPEILQGRDLQDNIALVFGKPKLAAFAHTDTVGLMVRYQNQLVPIGSPEINDTTKLVGEDSLGLIECGIRIGEDHQVFHTFMRGINTGTVLSFKPAFRQDGNFIVSPYLDNRIGIWNMLKLAETLENGIIFFSCGEEQGGGSVSYLTKLMYEEYKVRQALISDVTWATDGVKPGNGAVISLKDRYIPRRIFIEEIIRNAKIENIDFQLEVEDDGSSDGGEIQRSPYPVDWCFIGIACNNIHSEMEMIHLEDLQQMFRFYHLLFNNGVRI